MKTGCSERAAGAFPEAISPPAGREMTARNTKLLPIFPTLRVVPSVEKCGLIVPQIGAEHWRTFDECSFLPGAGRNVGALQPPQLFPPTATAATSWSDSSLLIELLSLSWKWACVGNPVS